MQSCLIFTFCAALFISSLSVSTESFQMLLESFWFSVISMVCHHAKHAEGQYKCSIGVLLFSIFSLFLSVWILSLRPRTPEGRARYSLLFLLDLLFGFVCVFTHRLACFWGVVLHRVPSLPVHVHLCIAMLPLLLQRRFVCVIGGGARRHGMFLGSPSSLSVCASVSPHPVTSRFLCIM